MIEAISDAVAQKIKQANPDETASVEKMKYALAMSISTSLIIASTLLIGAWTGMFPETLRALIAFAVLRRFSGGHHAKDLTTCFVVSTALLSTIPHIQIAPDYLWLINSFSLVIVLFYAPSNCIVNNIADRDKSLYQTIAILIVIAGYFIQMSEVTLAFLAQSLLLLGKGGDK
ncbi:MAG: accessory gene regulator ArgB-like protein [Clostridia bacterium]